MENGDSDDDRSERFNLALKFPLHAGFVHLQRRDGVCRFPSPKHKSLTLILLKERLLC